MDDRLYEANKAAVVSAIIATTDRTTVENVRHLAHDAAYEFNRAACDAIRELPEVNLESVLWLFGERP